MKFYAENKVNPFASCLPLLAQMPFFIGLFYLLQSDLRDGHLRRAATVGAKNTPCGRDRGRDDRRREFLFIPDLTAKATGWVLAVLIVLYIGSQLLSSAADAVDGRPQPADDDVRRCRSSSSSSSSASRPA